MRSINDIEVNHFANKISQAHYYIARFGVYWMFKRDKPHNDYDPIKLRRLVYFGFKLGQKIVLNELITLQSEIKNIKKEIKIKRKNKQFEEEKHLKLMVSLLEHQINIYKSLIDSIVWQVIRGEHYIARRFYTGETNEKDLSNPSFQLVIDYANTANSDIDKICIISDLSLYLQLGDCLIKENEHLSIVEIKSGKKNHKLIDKIFNENITLNNISAYKDFNKNDREQIKRILTQKSKSDKAKHILMHNYGKDPKREDTFNFILESEVKNENYNIILSKLIIQLSESDWSYHCLEGVVHIGVFKGKYLSVGKQLISKINSPYPVFDIMSLTNDMIREPIFTKPFPDETILNIVLGTIQIYIGVNLDMFIKLLNNFGIPARWSKTKEFNEFKRFSKLKDYEYMNFMGRGVIIPTKFTKSAKEESVYRGHHYLGSGYISKIVYDNIYPSVIARQIKQYIK